MTSPVPRKGTPSPRPAISTESRAASLNAAERLARLERIATALGAAHTLTEVADVIITEALEGLGGNAGAVALISEDRTEFHTIRCVGFAPEIVAAYTRYPYETRIPTADAVRSATTLFIESMAERNALYPHLANHKIRGGRGAIVALPLVGRDQVIGGMTLSFPDDRAFTEDDKRFIQTIAHLCAQALHRALLYDDAQREIAQRAAAEGELARLLEREHHVTATLQRSLLRMPPDGAFPGLALASTYESASSDLDVGGDFLDAFLVAPGKVAIVVGDVSGKGLPAAASTGEAKYTLRALLREYRDPAVVLGRLNNHLLASFQSDRDHQESFVALCLALVDTGTGHVLCSAAGMEPPLIVRVNGDTVEMPVRGLPLGVEPDARYTAVAGVMGVGDLIVVVTDGITEARRDGRLFGYDGLVEAARRERTSRSLGHIAQAILDEARIFAGGALRDDTAILVARRELL